MGLETIALLSVAVAAVGTGYSVHSGIEQGKMAEKAANFNAQVAENDALAAAQQAQYEADQVSRRNRIIMGKQRAAYAKSGVSGGSMYDVMYESYMQGELDRMATLYTGAVASNRNRSQAQLSRLEGRNAKTTGYLRAGSALLSGAGETLGAAGDYYKVKNYPRIG
jgi:hypothetical protein